MFASKGLSDLLEFVPWVQTTILAATIFAIIYGPIKAVQVTRTGDQERESRDRKYQILSDLMRTRQARIDPIHVGALNLVVLVFYGHPSIIEAYRKYIDHLNSPFPSAHDAFDRHIAQGNDFFTGLLFEIAKDLGFLFDKLELTRLGYLPVGLGSYQDNSMVNTTLLREILEGRRALPVTNFIAGGSAYPPSPSQNGDAAANDS